MNVKRFSARTSRDALNLVRQAFGEDAVVLSTRPCAEGVEVMAMAPDGVQQVERVTAEPAAPLMPVLRRPVVPPARAPAAAAERRIRFNRSPHRHRNRRHPSSRHRPAGCSQADPPP